MQGGAVASFGRFVASPSGAGWARPEAGAPGWRRVKPRPAADFLTKAAARESGALLPLGRASDSAKRSTRSGCSMTCAHGNPQRPTNGFPPRPAVLMSKPVGWGRGTIRPPARLRQSLPWRALAESRRQAKAAWAPTVEPVSIGLERPDEAAPGAARLPYRGPASISQAGEGRLERQAGAMNAEQSCNGLAWRWPTCAGTALPARPLRLWGGGPLLARAIETAAFHGWPLLRAGQLRRPARLN